MYNFTDIRKKLKYGYKLYSINSYYSEELSDVSPTYSLSPIR